MNRYATAFVVIAFVVIALFSPPLLADARYAPAGPSANAVETVNWTAGVSYTYDGAGNIRQIGNDRFVYDQVGRLVQAEINSVNRTYEYDAFGNRKDCTHAPGAATESNCQFGMNIDSSSNRVGGVKYDGAGNVETFSGHVYSYDAVDMPTRDDRGGGLAKEFIYTANDERIATYTVGSTWNWTIRDVSGKVLREFTSVDGSAGPGTGSWNWTRDNVFRDGLLLATRQVVDDAPVTYHYHLDHLGTARRVTDQDDHTVGLHDYYAFGPEVSGGMKEPAATSLQYTGHERDKWGGVEGPDALDYMHARYYSPSMGRFLSVDPFIDVKTNLRSPQGWNRYSYVRNNPMRWTDPTGRVIAYDEDFRKRVNSDADFQAAFDAWKKTSAGKAQWRTMGKDTNTLYTFKVATVKAMTGVLKEEQANGMTLPLVSARSENKRGKLDMSNVSMTINADFIKSTHSLVPEMTSRTMAKALFEEAQHGLDIGSGTMSAKQAWDAETRFHSDTEPRMKIFENQLNAILPPPNFD